MNSSPTTQAVTGSSTDCSNSIVGHKSISSAQHTVPPCTRTLENSDQSASCVKTPRPSKGFASNRRWLPSAKPSNSLKSRSGCTVRMRASGLIVDLAQRLHWKRLFTFRGQLPVGHQIFAMNLDPSLDQSMFCHWQAACQQTPIHNREARFAVMMTLIVKEIKHDDEAVENADGRHMPIVKTF